VHLLEPKSDKRSEGDFRARTWALGDDSEVPRDSASQALVDQARVEQPVLSRFEVEPAKVRHRGGFPGIAAAAGEDSGRERDEEHELHASS
jgi:hypothetical protein